MFKKANFHSYVLAILAVLAMFLGSCADNSLPWIDIRSENGISWNEKSICMINYFDGKDTLQLPGRIKFRGGSSSAYDKHSFSLELETGIDLCGLPTDDDWILNANYIDKTLMRHKISYDIYRQMNSNNVAAQCSYANVSLNGNYEGLYVVMQEVNASMIGLDKDDTEACLFKDPPVFFEERLDPVQDSTNYYQQKFPKMSDRDNSYQMDEFKHFIFNSNDKEFAADIGNWIDIENTIDWHILLLFSNNGDGVLKNFLLYRSNTHSPLRFAIWDYDHSFGRDGDNSLNMMKTDAGCNRSVLLRRLTEINETGYRSMLAKRWRVLRKSGVISSNNFQRQIDVNEELIRNDLKRNFEKWPIDSKWYSDQNDHEMELEVMMQFVELRIAQLDEHFENL